MALDRALEKHRDYLRRLLKFRMDDALRGRIDPSDVIQETHLEVCRRIDDFVDRSTTSFKLWLRRTALEQLIDHRRRHLVAAKRTAHREVAFSDASSVALATRLFDEQPSEAVQRRELQEQTAIAISVLSEADREILLLRHGEELTNSEAAEVLEISCAAASKRYGRALLRLRARLASSGALCEP